MKLAEFDYICRREYDNGEGIVTRLRLSPADLAEMANDVLAGDEPVRVEGDAGTVVAGARVGSLPHPVTRAPVLLSLAVPDGSDFTGAAEVTRWVPLAPVP